MALKPFLDDPELAGQTLFLLDGKTAQDFAGLKGNNSAEDFVLYTHEAMGTKKTEDTRAQVKEDGRRVGLRSIDRVYEEPIHEEVKAKRMVMCVLHCFSRLTESLIQLEVNAISAAGAQRLFLEESKNNRISKGTPEKVNAKRLNGFFRRIRNLRRTAESVWIFRKPDCV